MTSSPVILGPVDEPDNSRSRGRFLQRRRNRGAFFTPDWIAEVLANWAIRSSDESLLEPACGEAGLLQAAHARLHALGAQQGDVSSPQLVGFDVHEPTVQRAIRTLNPSVVGVEVRTADFLSEAPTEAFDIVLANPPFLRYHNFVGTQRSSGQESALALGVPLGGRASSWAAFLMHSMHFLKKGGRVAYVLPSEFLVVDYAAVIRDFLTSSFKSVRVVSIPAGQFVDAQVDVVLLLADGYMTGSSECIELTSWDESRGTVLPGRADSRLEVQVGGRWNQSNTRRVATAASSMSGHIPRPDMDGLGSWGRLHIGSVTGNNNFFILRNSEVEAQGLSLADCVPVVPPRLRFSEVTLDINSHTFDSWKRDDEAVWLFKPTTPMQESASLYVARGRLGGVHEGYKCRQRGSWWSVPLARRSDLILSYMSSKVPRARANSLALAHTNSLHGISLMPQFRDLGMVCLPILMLSSQVLLDAETNGRKYGGGVLKLELSEAKRLRVPGPAVAHKIAHDLNEMVPPLEKRLAEGDLMGAVALVDALVLGEGLGISVSEQKSMQREHARLLTNRKSRK